MPEKIFFVYLNIFVHKVGKASFVSEKKSRIHLTIKFKLNSYLKRSFTRHTVKYPKYPVFLFKTRYCA